MTDASPHPEPSGTDDPTPLAADPAAGTDAGRPTSVRTAADVGASVSHRRERPEPPVTWAASTIPSRSGCSLTLGGLVALLLGIALTNISTILVYIVFGDVRGPGPRPRDQVAEQAQRQARWAIAIVFLTGIVDLLIGLLLLVVPTLVPEHHFLRQGLPDDGRQLREDALLQVAREDLRHRPHRSHQRGGEVLQGPEERRGDRRRASQGRRRRSPTTISGLLIVVVLTLYFTRVAPRRSRTRSCSSRRPQPARRCRP